MTSAIGLEGPVVRLSQEVVGGVAAIVPATPQQLEPETGLTPSHVPASVAVVTEDLLVAHRTKLDMPRDPLPAGSLFPRRVLRVRAR